MITLMLTLTAGYNNKNMAAVKVNLGCLEMLDIDLIFYWDSWDSLKGIN